ncbi:hypothetical protein FPSE5266_20352 [Fusarium pseudograminearum]|nr:hypothetical protein FPSE5266_20352 [Fusarium pseudograminearum]
MDIDETSSFAPPNEAETDEATLAEKLTSKRDRTARHDVFDYASLDRIKGIPDNQKWWTNRDLTPDPATQPGEETYDMRRKSYEA